VYRHEVEHPSLADWRRAMVCRRAPESSYVVAGSTPVVAFGDPSLATVATLGINPSAQEFMERKTLLSGPNRRLSTLESLGAHNLEDLTDDQVQTVIADCASYFERNPYREWFNPLDQLLRGIGVSYFDGTACHLNLIQWATTPRWRNIPDKSVRLALLEDGVPHLRRQLEHEGIRTILLNGRQVLDQVSRAGLVDLVDAGRLALSSGICSLVTGQGSGVCWMGWSTNLQTKFRVSTEFVQRLDGWVTEVCGARSLAQTAV